MISMITGSEYLILMIGAAAAIGFGIGSFIYYLLRK